MTILQEIVYEKKICYFFMKSLCIGTLKNPEKLKNSILEKSVPILVAVFKIRQVKGSVRPWFQHFERVSVPEPFIFRLGSNKKLENFNVLCMDISHSV